MSRCSAGRPRKRTLESLVAESPKRSTGVEPANQGQTPHGTVGASGFQTPMVSEVPTLTVPVVPTPMVFTVPPAVPLAAYPTPPPAVPAAYLRRQSVHSHLQPPQEQAKQCRAFFSCLCSTLPKPSSTCPSFQSLPHLCTSLSLLVLVPSPADLPVTSPYPLTQHHHRGFQISAAEGKRLTPLQQLSQIATVSSSSLDQRLRHWFRDFDLQRAALRGITFGTHYFEVDAVRRFQSLVPTLHRHGFTYFGFLGSLLYIFFIYL
ncbi:uncharacterized protein LOC122026713 [Zingiber officinale]|uniref:uncharacterized protein LOC122026713 n=1 Tax=Zingiber officinale TaxID=94328 RepID=UPI001C4AC620|nr:uncharacterized protein LOC122026713 [Zingiber officinale]